MKVEIDGLDAVVRSLEHGAQTIRPKVEGVVLHYADLAADEMHRRVTSKRVKASITVDPSATVDGKTVRADAGPDRRASNQAFIARFLEGGTVKMAPRPFAAPTVDALAPGFARDLGTLLDDL